VQGKFPQSSVLAQLKGGSIKNANASLVTSVNLALLKVIGGIKSAAFLFTSRRYYSPPQYVYLELKFKK